MVKNNILMCKVYNIEDDVRDCLIIVYSNKVHSYIFRSSLPNIMFNVTECCFQRYRLVFSTYFEKNIRILDPNIVLTKCLTNIHWT